MNYRHGMRSTKIYGVWRSMRSRCENSNDAAFMNYGSRGIEVCERWKDFSCFYADMGEAPAGYSIDRKNNDRGYGPQNCYWANRKQQNRNRRGLHLITANGKTMSMGEWAEEQGIALGTIWNRIKLGWPEDKAVLTPLLRRSRRKP